MKTSRVYLSAWTALLLLSFVALADEPRSVRGISISGNVTIPTAKILECLTRHPAVLAAAESNHSDEDFAQAVEKIMHEGYKNAGFHESRIRLTQNGDAWTAQIEEGRRTLKGAFQVEGDPETSQWLTNAIADYQKDPNKSIWLDGYPWNGDRNLAGDNQKHLDQCLGTLGINPRFVTRTIQVEPSTASSPPVAKLILQILETVKSTHIESLKCATADRELIVAELIKHDLGLGARVDVNTHASIQKVLLASGKFDTVTVKMDPGQGFGDVALIIQGTRCDASPESLAARQKIISFSEMVDRLLEDGRGLYVTMSMDDMHGHLWVFQKTFGVELIKKDLKVARFFNNTATDKMVIETADSTRYAFGLPNFEFRFSVTPNESDGEKWKFDFGGDFKTDPKLARANRFQIDLSTLCKMFPLAETKLAEVKDGCVIQSPLGRLHLSANGQFNSLSINSLKDPDDSFLLEAVDGLPDHVRKLEVTDQDQLAFTIPEKEPDDPNSQKNAFYVLGNPKSLSALATFWFVDEVLKYGPGTAVYSLAELFSISNSEDKEAVHVASQRWLTRNAHGPFSTMAIAYCYANASDTQRAADYATEAMMLLEQEAGLRHDLDRIFIEGSTLGVAANQIDARLLHKFVCEFAKAIDSDDSFSAMLQMSEPPAVEPVEQWKFVVAKLVPIVLQAPMQSIAGQLHAGTTRTAARP